MIGDHWVHYALGLPLSATSANPSTLSAAPSTAPAASASPGNPTGSSVPGLEVVIVAFTEAVPAGAKASLTVKTAPNAACTIAVIYASGPSKAKGLEPKSSDPTGQVSWTWIVGSSTTPGDRSVTVTCAAGGRSGSVDETLAVE
jgi:micrococcal nuclease